MRLLFLGKRQPQQRDLLRRPYGRFYYLPTALAARGHDVTVLLCSHRRIPAETVVLDGVTWRSADILEVGPVGLRRRMARFAAEARPDWIVGMSDAWYGWLAHHLARRTDARLMIDAYDDYEAYMPWNLPLHLAWRRALRAANVATAAGPQLAQLLDRQRLGRRPADVVPMAADPGFVPADRAVCRATLDLPTDSPLMGYTGAWGRERGTDVLIEAFRIIRARRPDVRLVLTGRPPAYAVSEPGVLALGYIADESLPILLNALDMACVITADTAFGRYSYPAKLCEAMACGIPVVATATAPVRWMLNDDPRFLTEPGDPEGIAERCLANLNHPARVDYMGMPTWESVAHTLENCLHEASQH